MGSKMFILVPGYGPHVVHVVDVLCRSYQLRETKSYG